MRDKLNDLMPSLSNSINLTPIMDLNHVDLT